MQNALKTGITVFYVFIFQTGVEYPQITVPQRMIEKLAKKKTKQAIVAAGKKKINYKSPLIIAGKRKEYNHHRGQPFSEFDVAKLSSHGWKHAKSKGDYFTIMKHKGVRVVYIQEIDLQSQ